MVSTGDAIITITKWIIFIWVIVTLLGWVDAFLKVKQTGTPP
jgi:hypothetical protein